MPVYINAQRDLAVVIAAYLEQTSQYTLSSLCRPSGSLAIGDYDVVALRVSLDTKMVEFWSVAPWPPRHGEVVISVNSVLEFRRAFAKVTDVPKPAKSWAVGCQIVRVSADGKNLIVGPGTGESTVTRAQVQEILDAMNPTKRSWKFGNRKVELSDGGLSIGVGEAYVTQATVEDMLNSLKA